MTSLIVFFLLFLLPFVVLPFDASSETLLHLTSQFETPKVIIAELLILLLGACILSKENPKVFLQKKFLLFLGIGILGIYHSAFRMSPVLLFGNTFRMQGMFLFFLLLFFAVIVGKVIGKNPSRKNILILLVLQGLAALCIGATVDGRAIGTVGEPNALAASVVFLWPWLLSEKRDNQKVKRWFPVAGVVITLFIIILSGSRSGLLAFGIQGVFFFLYSMYKLNLRTSVIISFLLISFCLLLPLLDKQTLYENRGEIWNTALVAGYEQPIAGWGFGNVEIALKKYNTKLFTNIREYYVDSSHNFLLDYWVQGGFVGLVFIVMIVFSVTKSLVTKKNTRDLLLLFGLLTVMLFNPVSIITVVQFWWLVGKNW